MCTVSFIPLSDQLYCLTSNRDEWNARPTLAPVSEAVGNVMVTYPKDLQAGGTWIAAGDNGRVCCLLNGAFERHERKLPYAISRGKIVLQAFDYEHVDEFFEQVELEEVEPFTLVVIDKTVSGSCNLLEFRWDAEKKHIKKLSPTASYIWSSATLYEPELRLKKEMWFATWLEKQKQIMPEEIFNFHAVANGQDVAKKMVLENNFGLQTVSITQVEIVLNDSFSMTYTDLLKNDKTSVVQRFKG
jgi:Transport and Golgi organisation 2